MVTKQIHMQLAQQIVDTLKTICNHDINFIDVHGRIIASTDPHRVGSYHDGGHEAARTGEIVTIEEDDPDRDVRRGINMPIRFHKETVAVIGITGDAEGVRKYASLAQRITLLLLREHEIDARNYDTRTQTGYLVRSLIDREVVPREFISTVLERNDMTDEGESWRTLVIQLQESHENLLSTIERAVEDTASRTGKCLYAYRFPNEYILLVKDRDSKRWDYAMHELGGKFRKDIKIGIGSARSLLRQDLSFQAARLAIASLAAGENIAAYESFRLELLLSSVSPAAGAAYIRKCLEGLDDSDRELLNIYFTAEMSLKKTAEQCFLHINTLQYRLNRVRDRCGLDPRRFREASMLYTALRLEAFKGTWAEA